MRIPIIFRKVFQSNYEMPFTSYAPGDCSNRLQGYNYSGVMEGYNYFDSTRDPVDGEDANVGCTKQNIIDRKYPCSLHTCEDVHTGGTTAAPILSVLTTTRACTT